MKRDYYHKDVFANRRGSAGGSRFWIWSLALFIFGLILIGASYFFIYGDFFKVKKINISGAKFIEERALMSLVLPQLISNYPWRAVFSPRHIFFWEFAESRPINSNSLPILGEVKIGSSLLKREVGISIKEKSLFGVLCLPIFSGTSTLVSSKDCYSFDDKGVIFAPVPKTEGVLILKVEKESPSKALLGQSLFKNGLQANNFFKVLKTMTGLGLKASLIKIRDPKLEEWEAKVVQGPVFYFSLNQVPDNLASILENLDKKFDFNELQYLDFRVSNRIYYK